ncbi:General transcription factor IIE subunit 1 [Glugoides intestinalis]
MTLEYEPTMKKLIKLVTRSFYEPHHVVITDILLENMLLSDAEFCAKMKMLNREFNKLIIRLKDDRLIKSDIKVETKEDNKQVLKSVYFFNYAEIRDVIKYKIFKMTTALEIKQIAEEEAFYCDLCDRYFSALDAQALVENFSFKCIFCKTELQENTHKNNEKDIELKELLSDLKNVVILLKEAERFEIPSMDYFQILELKKEKERCDSAKEMADMSNKAPSGCALKIEPEKQDGDSNEFSCLPVLKTTLKEKSNLDDFVTVNGKPKKFSEITEDDKDLMNEDEYTNYFEMYNKYHES